RMVGELKRVGSRNDATGPVARAAVAFGNDTRWGTGLVQTARGIDCVAEATRVHTALMRANVTTDAPDPRDDLSPYRLVICPRLILVDEAIACNLRGYVGNGGTLLLTAHSGVVDAAGKSFDTPRPGPLADMAGIEVSDMALLDGAVALAGDEIPELRGRNGGTLADEIQVRGATVLATFDSGWRAGLPALTSHGFGDGVVYYLGTALDDLGMDALIRYLCGKTGVQPVMDTAAGVHAYERRGETERLVFLLNFTESEQAVQLPGGWVDCLTDERVDSVAIPAVDLRILARRLSEHRAG
ncbi:MAG: hypothetical protein E4H09_01655, partial [Spirochaetales bacterium]